MIRSTFLRKGSDISILGTGNGTGAQKDASVPSRTRRIIRSKSGPTAAATAGALILFYVLFTVPALMLSREYRSPDSKNLRTELAAKERTTPENELRNDASKSAGGIENSLSVKRPVHMLRLGDFEQIDAFAATWLQSVPKFKEMEVGKIQTVEDGCWIAFSGKRKYDVRMTMDWLDFSVEHMSQWWRTVQVFRNSVPFNTIIPKLVTYVQSSGSEGVVADETMRTTIAVVAFQPWKKENKPEKARALTINSLAATVTSLAKAAFGRVLVVGYDESDFDIIQEAFRLVTDSFLVTDSILPEFGFVKAKHDAVKTDVIEINMPKAALSGLQQALKGEIGEVETKQWLGATHEISYWRNVYLTEPDTILQTRPSSLPQLRHAVDQGLIVVPHRLQPLPHESDLVGFEEKGLFVPSTGSFSLVTELDAVSGDACCDVGNEKPGQPPHIPGCGKFWYMCGFDPTYDRSLGPKHLHRRLLPYGFMRLARGTGVVNLAATEHGRRCKPQKNAICKPSSR